MNKAMTAAVALFGGGCGFSQHAGGGGGGNGIVIIRYKHGKRCSIIFVH